MNNSSIVMRNGYTMVNNCMGSIMIARTTITMAQHAPAYTTDGDAVETFDHHFFELPMGVFEPLMQVDGMIEFNVQDDSAIAERQFGALLFPDQFNVVTQDDLDDLPF